VTLFFIYDNLLVKISQVTRRNR